jgi:hypothetical protein
MATESLAAPTSDVAILSRLFRAEEGRLTAEAAESLLRIRFEPRDLDRMHELAARHQDDALGPAERVEMENYRRVGFLLDLMHSRVRRVLSNQRPAP